MPVDILRMIVGYVAGKLNMYGLISWLTLQFNKHITILFSKINQPNKVK